MYWVICGAVIFAAWAMMVREGLWSNTLALVNIVVSGLVAFGFYQPIVIYLDEATDGRHTYWLDFTILWALYCATMVVCRALTSAASKTRMRFKHPVDPVGGPLLGLIAAWVLATFTMSTLHTAPMGRDAFGGKLVHTENEVQTASPFTSPDLGWLRFVERVSPSEALGAERTTRFGARGFVKIYEDRRSAFEKAPRIIVPRG